MSPLTLASECDPTLGSMRYLEYKKHAPNLSSINSTQVQTSGCGNCSLRQSTSRYLCYSTSLPQRYDPRPAMRALRQQAPHDKTFRASPSCNSSPRNFLGVFHASGNSFFLRKSQLPHKMITIASLKL